MDVQLHSFLKSAVDGIQWLASRVNRFTPGKRGCWYPFNRGQGRKPEFFNGGGVGPKVICIMIHVTPLETAFIYIQINKITCSINHKV
jgi:hypothetical protein